MPEQNDSLNIVPMTNYTPPKLPTLQSAKNNPALLKKLPSRWQKNAAVIACIGIMGAMSLTACDSWAHHGGAGEEPFYVVSPTETEAPTITPVDPYENYWMHHGGAGGEEPFYVVYPTEQEIGQDSFDQIPPVSEELLSMLTEAELEMSSYHGGEGEESFYIVHITEQEVLAFIKAKLEEVGLDMSAAPPEYAVESEVFPDHEFVLYDSRRRVAVAFFSTAPSEGGQDYAIQVAREFSRQNWRTNIGVFHNPYKIVGEYEINEEARAELIENIAIQVKSFIFWLEWEGVIWR